MKLKKSQIKEFIRQAIIEVDAEKAKKMGLKSKGFGNWVDPKSGEKYTTKGGKLHKVGDGEKPGKDDIEDPVQKDPADDPKYTKAEADKLDSVSEGEYKVRFGIDKPGIQVGVIAQELESIKSDWVKTSDNDKKIVDSSELIWNLVNAVKELSAENNTLKARLDAAGL